MIRLNDILNKNKKLDISLEDLVEGLSQLSKIGQELLKSEADRISCWKSIQVPKDITVSRGIAEKSPWEMIKVHCLSIKASFHVPPILSRVEQRSWNHLATPLTPDMPWSIRAIPNLSTLPITLAT